ncbi:MAG: helix-turn-helix domain-containing protein [Marmoricola sp.]
MSEGASAYGLDEVLTRHDVGLSSRDLALELDTALRAVSTPGATPLTGDEVAFLRAHVPAAKAALDAWDPDAERRAAAQRATRRLTAAVASSYGVAEVADLLGVDRSRIAHRISQGALYAFTLGRNRRIPRWQVLVDEEQARLLPGLPTIVAATPDGLAPHMLEAFLRTPQDDLEGETPLDFLAAGGNPELVAGYVGDLGRW